MKLILHILLLTITVHHIKSTLYNQVKDAISNIFGDALGVIKPVRRSSVSGSEPKKNSPFISIKNKNADDVNIHKNTNVKLHNNEEKHINTLNDLESVQPVYVNEARRIPRASRQGYLLDPAMSLPGSFRRINNHGPYRRLNNRRFRRLKNNPGPFRRSEKKDDKDEKDFREAWQEKFKLLKEQAQKEYLPPGDKINMMAARPWDMRCGDPNQHDMPWGTCMYAAECEPEDRIYRGDLFCGHSRFICCALQAQVYDVYQGSSMSFEDKSLSTNSEERANRKEEKESEKSKKERKENREKRKKKMIKTIKEIVKEINKLLKKEYKKRTKEKEKKTKIMTKFVKFLKKEYKNNRIAVQQIHTAQLTKIDAELMQKLNELSAVNKEFLKNDTFRAIVINGTINAKGARMLLEAYPDLVDFMGNTANRRSGGEVVSRPAEPRNYDLEYGYLYY